MSLLERLIEAGTPADLVAEVARELARAEGDRCEIERLRSGNAARQQRWRDRNKEGVTSHNVTSRYVTSPAKKPPHTPQKNTTTPVSLRDTAPRGAEKRASRISEDWTPPSVADLPPKAQNLAKGWSAESYQTEAEAFLNYWLAEGGAKARKHDWNRTWANRITQVNGRVLRDERYARPSPSNDTGSFLQAKLAKQRGQ